MVSHSSDARMPYRAVAMPPPVIPMKHTAWFMWLLWALAGFMLVGLAYSFWLLSSVASPKLDAPVQPPTIGEHAG